MRYEKDKGLGSSRIRYGKGKVARFLGDEIWK
jgi:hypothetical protein